MAKRDVVNYYISVQTSYFEMLDCVRDFDEALKAGKFTQEQYEQAVGMVEKARENYDRISYIMLLLQEPNRASKKAQFRKRNKMVYDYLANSSDCYIKSENDDILKKLKEMIKGIKEGEKTNG